MTDSTQLQPRILLLLGQGFDDMEAAAFIDVCGWTSYRKQNPKVQLDITGLQESSIRGRFGTELQVSVPLSKICPEHYSAIALPGGFRSHGYNEMYDERIYSLLQKSHQSGAVIATICVGILPVAEAGLVKGRLATTYPYSRHDNIEQLLRCGAVLSDKAIVIDNRIISCAGPAQSLAVAISMLNLVLGSEVTNEIMKFMCYEL